MSAKTLRLEKAVSMGKTIVKEITNEEVVNEKEPN